MAHFLEHLVFKGGEKYPTYRDVNEAAERIGAVLNAYTSHDLVAFHITARANKALEAADLLTDFVGRPKIDADELNRERGVVVQEIARADDQPAVMAEHLIDEAAFGDHPLGRPVLGPAEHIHDTFTRDGIVEFRNRRWAPEPGRRVPRRQPRGPAPGTAPSTSCSPAFRPTPRRRPTSPRRRSSRASSSESATPTSPICGCPTGPDRDRDAKQRAALTIYSTLLGGSMGSRLFDEIREQRGLAYSVHSIAHAYADVPVLQLSAGLESSKMLEAYRRMRDIVTELRDDGPTEAEVERARAYAAGARAIAFENTGAIARHAAQQTIVYGEDVDPDRTIALLDEVTFDEVREVAARVADELSVACVGPHTVEELESA